MNGMFRLHWQFLQIEEMYQPATPGGKGGRVSVVSGPWSVAGWVKSLGGRRRGVALLREFSVHLFHLGLTGNRWIACGGARVLGDCEKPVMPRQNRVTPFGGIVATPERGTLFGNRGVLHDPQGRIKRDWALKRWLICVLEFRGRYRVVMSPGRYTELFFLDEATALAAGHRPCAECQRARYNEYRDAWARGNLPGQGLARVSADEIDAWLHAQRLGPARSKLTWTAHLDELPDGVFITREGAGDRVLLIQGDSLLRWSPGGYQERLRCRDGERVSVLTPESTVEAIRAGFAPGVHLSGFAKRR